MTIYTVNKSGLDQIKNILLTYHKKFQEVEPTIDMLNAWASDVEESLNNGNGACFEIKSHDHILGRTEEFTLTTDVYSQEEIEE